MATDRTASMSDSPSLPSTLVSDLDTHECRQKMCGRSVQMQRVCAHQINKSKRNMEVAKTQLIEIRNQFQELECELAMRTYSVADVLLYRNLKREKEYWLGRIRSERVYIKDCCDQVAHLKREQDHYFLLIHGYDHIDGLYVLRNNDNV